ncbi:HU family DNA-binding protein [Sulfitobacter geojensis]|uniref:HU family DNA-binding protein n=1 Tax=Sulfitobacter geojensis TaxID=1342299 RepID=UPI000A708224|nr:HU family DNA-binding protein [Sulfitobacter geojensis]
MSTASSKPAKPDSAAKASKTPKAAAKTKAATAKPAVTEAAVPETSVAKPAASSGAPTSALDGSAPAPAKQAEPRVVDAPQPVIVGPMMRKKELIDTVVERSGMKKKDVKPVVEMMLSVLGEAIGDNRELNLPPMGRMKIRREKKLSNGRIVVAKIRQSTPPEQTASQDTTDQSDI